MNDLNRRKQEVFTSETSHDINKNIDEAAELDSKLTNTVTQLIKRSDDCYFQSRLRFIFLKWAQFTKRQKAFATEINNIIRKTMLQNGFDNVNAFAQDKQLTRDQNKMANGMKNMYWRHLVGNYFSHWKG